MSYSVIIGFNLTSLALPVVQLPLSEKSLPPGPFGGGAPHRKGWGKYLVYIKNNVHSPSVRLVNNSTNPGFHSEFSYKFIILYFLNK